MAIKKKAHAKRPKKAAGRSTAGNTRKKAKSRRSAAEPPADALAAALFPSLKAASKPAPLGVFLAVADRIDDKPVVRFTRREISQTRSGRPSKRGSCVMSRTAAEQAAQVLTGLAHADRLLIAQSILQGANTHKALEQATQLKAGPLYHHIRSLERAGILQIVSRNTYSLTDFGQVSLLVISGLAGGGVSGKNRAWRRIALRGSQTRKKS